MPMTSLNEAFILVFAMGAAILFCRAFPFLFFGKSADKNAVPSGRGKFLNFVEKTVPPAAMTVLTFNALGGAFLHGSGDGLLAIIAAGFTAAVHVWKGNPLFSIFGGTAVYMILQRLFHTI